MRFVNLTPHPIHVFRMDGPEVLVTLMPHEKALRLEEKDEQATMEGFSVGDPSMQIDRWESTENYFLGTPVITRSFAAPDLPEEKEGVVYVVSLPALMGLRAAGVTRGDVLAPDTGSGPYGAVRDAQGQVRGVRRFIAIGEPYQSDWTRGKSWPMDEWLKANPVEW